MRLRAASIVLALLASATSLEAECFICDYEVALDPERAACFQQKADDFLAAARADALNRVEVDVLCTSTRGGLEHFPTLSEMNVKEVEVWRDAESAMGRLKDRYLLDADGIECIIRRLERDNDVVPGIVIDMARDCE